MVKRFSIIFGWGIALWFIGYILGIIFFLFIPSSLIGWFILPIGFIITIWVLITKIKFKSFNEIFLIAVIWTCLAFFLDYIFILKLLKPADGYYKLDVYLYYFLTFILPITIGYYKTKVKANNKIVG